MAPSPIGYTHFAPVYLSCPSTFRILYIVIWFFVMLPGIDPDEESQIVWKKDSISIASFFFLH